MTAIVVSVVAVAFTTLARPGSASVLQGAAKHEQYNRVFLFLCLLLVLLRDMRHHGIDESIFFATPRLKPGTMQVARTCR